MGQLYPLLLIEPTMNGKKAVPRFTHHLHLLNQLLHPLIRRLSSVHLEPESSAAIDEVTLRLTHLLHHADTGCYALTLKGSKRRGDHEDDGADSRKSPTNSSRIRSVRTLRL